MVLTPAAALGEDLLWPLRLTMALVASATVVVVGRYAARLAGRRAGWATAGIMAIYPPLVANDTVTLTEPLAVLLVVAALVALDEERWAWCGVATGLLLLARPNGYLVAVILGGFLWPRVGARRVVGYLGVALLCVAPWMVRNQVQVGTPRLTTSDGFTLAAIYSEQAQAVGGFVDPVFDEAFDEPRFRWAQFDEAAWSAELTRAAREGLADDPSYVVEVVGRNAMAFFEVEPGRNRWAEDNDGRDWDVRTAALPLYWAVTVAGVVGVARRWRDRRLWPLLAITAQFVALSLALVAPPRLRTPFDVLCCIGVGLLVATPADGRGGRSGVDAPDVARRTLRAGDEAGVVGGISGAQSGGAHGDGVPSR